MAHRLGIKGHSELGNLKGNGRYLIERLKVSGSFQQTIDVEKAKLLDVIQKRSLGRSKLEY